MVARVVLVAVTQSPSVSSTPSPSSSAQNALAPMSRQRVRRRCPHGGIAR